MGYGDGGALHHAVSERATYLELVPGQPDFFAVVASSGDGFEVTARHLGSPTAEISSLRVDGGAAAIDGDLDVWGQLPSYYRGRIESRATGLDGGYVMVRVEPAARRCVVQPMSWFSGEAFDLMYQSLGRPTALRPDRVAFSVQRSSHLVVYDWAAEQVVGNIELADRSGNPQVAFRTPDELWVSDYDTLLVLDATDLSVRRHQACLQAPVDGMGHFIGDWSFTPDRKRCIVPRPASGDALILDCDTFQIADRVQLGRQPLEATLLEDGRVFARDWKTGDLLVGAAEH